MKHSYSLEDIAGKTVYYVINEGEIIAATLDNDDEQMESLAH